jgi:cytochrome-b5 reductase
MLGILILLNKKSGPKGRFEYKKNMFKEIGMIAGGTGITPMLQ